MILMKSSILLYKKIKLIKQLAFHYIVCVDKNMLIYQYDLIRINSTIVSTCIHMLHLYLAIITHGFAVLPQ